MQQTIRLVPFVPRAGPTFIGFLEFSLFEASKDFCLVDFAVLGRDV